MPGKRGELTQLQWQTAAGQWQDLVDNQRYRVVMNAYSADGNDGWQALARAQSQQAERLDLAWVDGKLTGFPIEKVEQSGDQLSARYAPGQQLDCKASSVNCGTDAASFVQYVREQRPTLTALTEETVTLLRAE